MLPIRLATSKFALKAYLTSILFFSTTFLLFGVAVIAYVLFYWSYIPRIGFTRAIHLQYDPIPLECRSYLSQMAAYPPPGHQHPLYNLAGLQPSTDLSPALAARCAGSPAPWGIAAIAPELIGQQAYDVVAELNMPRTRANLDAGNFMVDARLLSTPIPKDSLPDYVNVYDSSASTDTTSRTAESTLAHARRATLLPYRSPLLSLYDTVLSLPRATFGLPTETSTVRVPLFTRVAFPRGRARVPTAVHLQLQTPSGIQLQLYSAQIHFRARFSGLRYLMYNFRLTTACVFVGLFFVTEAVAALAVYGILSFVVFGGSSSSSDTVKQEPRVKKELTDGDDTDDRYLSDTERSFPTYGTQQPLRYQGRQSPVKTEPQDNDDGDPGPSSEQPPPYLTPGPGGDADDEDDEDADFVLDDAGKWRDSGLGTSMESGRERTGAAGVRRRRSRGGSGTGQGLL